VRAIDITEYQLPPNIRAVSSLGEGELRPLNINPETLTVALAPVPSRSLFERAPSQQIHPRTRAWHTLPSRAPGLGDVLAPL